MPVVANAWIEINPSMKGFRSKVASELNGLSPMGDKAGSTLGGKLMSGVGKAFKVSAAGVGVAAGGVLAASIAKGMGRLTAIEGAQAKLAGLGNDAAEVAGIMDNALASVKGTAHGLGEAATTSAMLVAAGVSQGKELETTLKTVGDVAAISGRTMADIGTIFGSVAARGKLQGDDMLQLMSSGVPVLQLLADELGTTSAAVSEMVSAGEIDFATFEEAMREGMGGAALEMGETFRGAFANMGAAAGRFGATLAGPAFAAAPAVFGALGGVFDQVNDAIAGPAERIGQVFVPAAEKLADVIGTRVGPHVAEVAGRFGDLAAVGVEKALAPESLELVAGLWENFKDSAGRVWESVSPLVPALLDLAPALASVAGSLSVATWQVFGSVLESVSPLVETVLVPLVEKVSELAVANPGAVASVVGAFLGFKALGAIAGPVSAGLGAVGKVVGFIGSLGKLGASVGPVVKMLGTVVRFINPWVAGFTLAAGALTLFFTKTETGQKLWQGFVDALGAGWEWVQEKFQAGVERVSGAVGAVGDVVSVAWEKVSGVLELVGGQIGDGFRLGFEMAVTAVSTGWQIIQDVFAGAFLTLKALFTGQWGEIPGIISATFESVKGRIGDALANALGLVGEWKDNTIARFGEMASGVIDLVVAWGQHTVSRFVWVKNTAVDLMKELPGVITSFFADMATKVAARLVSWVADVAVKFAAAKNTAVDKVKSLPGEIRNLFANAGTWLVNAGRNIISGLLDGLRQRWSAVTDWFAARINDVSNFFSRADATASSRISYSAGGGSSAMSAGGVVPGYAQGGYLRRIPGIPDSTRDPILGVNAAGVPVARVEPGEFVVNRKATRAFRPVLEAINGGRVNPRLGDFGLPGYANGGVVSARQLLDFAAGKKVGSNKAPRSLEGAAYVWGGGLLGNWGDCSGAMSGLAALTVGMNIAGRKFATMNEASVLSSMGFSRGTSPGKNAFEVGFFNGGPWGGHTSGTVYDDAGRGTNLEMGGGRGNGQIGGRAAGARHSQYTDHFWIGLKTAVADQVSGVVSTSVDGMTVKTETDDNKFQLKQLDWGSAQGLFSEWEKRRDRQSKLKAWTAGVYDTGGILRPGGIAVNQGGPEYVLPTGVTTAMMKVFQHIPGLARALEKFVAVDWNNLGAELKAAFNGGGGNFTELARLFGDEVGQRIATEVGFAGAQMRDVQKGDNIRAYLTGMSASEGVSLADHIGSLIGIDGIGSTFGGVASAWEDLQDAAIGQVDAANAVKQAELNLADARKSGDAQAVAEAEDQLAGAMGAVKMAAAATGQAQIAMAVQVAEVAVKAFKMVWDTINRAFAAIGQAKVMGAQAVSSWADATVKQAEMFTKQREALAGFAMDFVKAQIDMANAARNRRFVEIDSAVKAAEAIVDVAEAQAAFDAQRRADMNASLWLYDDLSMGLDRYRWNMSETIGQNIDELAAWSDETHAKYSELLAAQLGLSLVESIAKRDALEAAHKQALAALAAKAAVGNLEHAAKSLAVMTANNFGMDMSEATVGQRIAKLMEERAELEAKNGEKSLSIIDRLSGARSARNSRMSAIDKEIAALQNQFEVTPAFRDAVKATQQQMGTMGWLGFFGRSDTAKEIIQNGPLGDAARALDRAAFEQSMLDIDKRKADLGMQQQESSVTLQFESELAALEGTIKAIQLDIDSNRTAAKAWRAGDDMVREALMRLSGVQSDAAVQTRAVSTPELVVQVSADVTAISLDQLKDILTHVNGRIELTNQRVDKLENPVVPGVAVTVPRRG